MTEEIKEILDLLNFNKDTILNRTCRVEDFMSREQIIKLLDYITNLQQENERLKEIIKDNTILVKDENGNYQECNINPLDYKSRCEKAIEYIKKHTYNPSQTINDERLEVNPKYLLNILNGSDENE